MNDKLKIDRLKTVFENKNDSSYIRGVKNTLLAIFRVGGLSSTMCSILLNLLEEGMKKAEKLLSKINEASLSQPHQKSMVITSKDVTTDIEVMLDGLKIRVNIFNDLLNNLEEEITNVDLTTLDNLDMLDFLTYKGLDIEFREIADEISKMLKSIMSKTKNSLKSYLKESELEIDLIQK